MPSERTLAIGRWLFRRRDYTPIPLVVVVLIFAAPTPRSLVAGGGLALAGELLRFVSVATIGAISRTRNRAVNRLVDRGLFSIVRNPLYAGNFLLSLGLVVASGAPTAIFVSLYLLFFGIQYAFIVRWEESVLEEEFGQPYQDYRERVPRWLPKPWLFRRGEADWARALRSEWPTLLAIGAAWTALLLLRTILDGSSLWEMLAG